MNHQIITETFPSQELAVVIWDGTVTFDQKFFDQNPFDQNILTKKFFDQKGHLTKKFFDQKVF